MKNIKIAVFSAYYPVQGGGIERVAEDLIYELINEYPIDVEWLAADDDYLFTKSPLSKQQLTLSPLFCYRWIERFIGVPLPMPHFRSLYSIIKTVRKSDLIHMHDFIYPCHIFAWFIAKFFSKPIIITQHIGEVPYRNKFVRGLLTITNKFLGTVMLGRSSAVVFISNRVQNYFQSLVKTSFKQWHYVPNGLNSQLFCRDSFEDVININDKPILFVGRFVEKKGLYLLKQLVASMPQYKWIFIGKGDIDPREWGYTNLTIVDFIPQDQLVKYYRSSSMLILPSLGEGFPLVIQEAMSSGLPVITTCETAAGCAAAKDLMLTVRSNKLESIDKWKEKVTSLYNDEVFYHKTMNDSKSFAKSHWSWGLTAKKYKQLFLDVLEG